MSQNIEKVYSPEDNDNENVHKGNSPSVTAEDAGKFSFHSTLRTKPNRKTAMFYSKNSQEHLSYNRDIPNLCRQFSFK